MAAYIESDPAIEAWLRSFGVNSWCLETVPLASIDAKAGLANQARLMSLDEEVVKRYRRAVETGAVFPPLVLARVGKKLIPMDGNHRIRAFVSNGVDVHPAYIVTVTETVRAAMTLAANTLNGEPPTDAERRHHAMTLVGLGFTREETATMTGLSPHAISNAVQAKVARERCGSVVNVASLSDSVMSTLGTLASDVVLHECARIALEYDMKGSNVSGLINRVRKSRSESGQLAIAGEERGYLETERENRKKPIPRGRSTDVTRAKEAFAKVLKIDPHKVARQANGNADELKVSCMAAAEHLMAVADAL